MFLSILTILLGVVFALYLLHLYITKTYHSVFKNANIPYIEPTPFLGMPKEIFTFKMSQSDMLLHFYNRFKGHKMYGSFEGINPTLGIRDPALAKQILVKDFDHFSDRRDMKSGSKSNFFEKSLVGLEGQQWKDVRGIMTPAFTSGNLKRILNTIEPSVKECMDYLQSFAATGEPLEFKDTAGRFTIDVIALAAFGIKCNSFVDKNAMFPTMGNNLMKTSSFDMFKLFLAFFAPFTRCFIKADLFQEESVAFFDSIVRETIAAREKEGLKGRDFLDLALQARNGELNEDGTIEEKSTKKNVCKSEFTDEHVIAQSILFIFGGFETTSTVLCFLCYELGINPDIQDKLRSEIQDVIERDGKITYENIQSMEYMDMVLNESMRRHTPSPTVERMCTKDYTIPGTNYTVKKGNLVMFPIVGIHRNPEFYPDPEKFDPERFSKEEKAKRDPCTFMPFGFGPRNCIAQRFAILEVKYLMANMLSQYQLLRCEKTIVPIEYEKSLSMRPKGGIWLKVEKIN